MRDNKVQSVTRAIQLLDILANQPDGAAVNQLAELSGLHNSTVSRLIITLEAAGAVGRVGQPPKIHIAPDFAQRLIRHSEPSDLRSIVTPFLHELSEQFGEAASLALHENDLVVYVDQVSPNQAIQVKDWSDSRFPLHTVSAGKLFLAHWPEPKREHYLSQPLAAYTDNTITDPRQLRDAFIDIRQSGVSWIFDEFTDGLSGVAAPIVGRNKALVGALTVFAPSYRFPGSHSIDAINLIMSDFAARCSADVQKQLE